MLVVVATEPISAERLLRAAPELSAAREVLVVPTPSSLSRLEWLANDEDEARMKAAEAAADTVQAIEEQGTAAEGGVGDVDPLQAAEDALAQFEADEIVVVLPSEQEASWLERSALRDGFERLGPPVRHVVADPGESGR